MNKPITDLQLNLWKPLPHYPSTAGPVSRSTNRVASTKGLQFYSLFQRAGRSHDINEPLAQVRQSLKLGFQRIHRFLGQLDSSLIDSGGTAVADGG